MLVLMAALLFVFTQLPAGTAGDPGARQVSVPPAPVTAPAVFPPLRLQGIVKLSGETLALINGKTYAVGERVDDVRIVAIHGETVTVSLDGKTNVLRIVQGLTIAPPQTGPRGKNSP